MDGVSVNREAARLFLEHHCHDRESVGLLMDDLPKYREAPDLFLADHSVLCEFIGASNVSIREEEESVSSATSSKRGRF